MDTCCSGDSDVLGPAESVEAEGTGGAEDVGDVGNVAVTIAAADGEIWGSYVSSAGWSTVMSSAMS